MAMSRIPEDKGMSVSSTVSSFLSSFKAESPLSARRRQFKENRSKSAVDIATDYLLCVQSQDSSMVSSAAVFNAANKKEDSDRRSTPLATPKYRHAQSMGSQPSSARDSIQQEEGPQASGNDAGTADTPVRQQPTSQQECSSMLPFRVPESESSEDTFQQPRASWRKVIFQRVCTSVTEDSCVMPDDADGDLKKTGKKKMSKVARTRWKTAMLETLLLLRQEKDTIDSTGKRESSADQKLGYVELTPCSPEASQQWENLLQAASTGSPYDTRTSTLLSFVKKGVPKSLRGSIWRFLALQQSNHSHVDSSVAELFEVPYPDLLEQTSDDQHAILIDLGRTFPGHPYFSRSLGLGQLELFNLLKAYSLLDEEMGYCQGVSFIAGLLLMHMEETAAFEMIRHMMLNLGLRDQYCPNMTALQLKLYQFVRLVHDHDKEVYSHIEEHEIAPALYATPWFLTLFASQYPLSFVARVFDLLFVQGPEVIFKVALKLIQCHRELILHYDNFEELVEFLKTGLPEMAHVQMERVVNQVFDMDISQDLQTYTVEFHVFREEMLCASQTTAAGHQPSCKQSTVTTLQNTVLRLRHKNHELTEKLQNMESEMHTHQMAASQLRLNEDKLKAQVRALELERSALLMTVTSLKATNTEKK